MKDYKWYTNGIKQIQIKVGNPIPEGFKPGRLPRDRENVERQIATMKATYSEERKQKHSQRMKEIWAKRSKEEKDRIIGKWTNGENRKGLEPWNKGKHNVQVPWNKGKKGINCGWNEQSARKRFETRLKNGGFKNKDTKIEIETFNTLLKYFNEDDIFHPYRDEEKYPFNCDFYIKSLDLFIEINEYWTHNTHPFDPNNEDDLKQLEIWKEKAKTKPQYQNAIETWTIRDINKFNKAKENNLNYLPIYHSRGGSETIENIILEEISKLRSE